MEVADSDFEATKIAEDEEETKGETTVAFTEEDRLHADFTKFFKQQFTLDMENRVMKWGVQHMGQNLEIQLYE